MPIRQFLGKHTPLLIGMLFVYSGVYKLLYPGEATSALIALDISTGLAITGIIAVTILELYVGIILLAKLDVKYGLGLTTALVFIFAVFLCYLSTLANPPSCGCMGLTAVFQSNRHNAILGLLRNCIILWLLSAGYTYYYNACKPARSELA